jgi:hypothetical protein
VKQFTWAQIESGGSSCPPCCPDDLGLDRAPGLVESMRENALQPTGSYARVAEAHFVRGSIRVSLTSLTPTGQRRPARTKARGRQSQRSFLQPISSIRCSASLATTTCVGRQTILARGRGLTTGQPHRSSCRIGVASAGAACMPRHDRLMRRMDIGRTKEMGDSVRGSICAAMPSPATTPCSNLPSAVSEVVKSDDG